MAGRDVTLVAGQYYHLYNRGNNRQPIFFERENYLHFLRQVRKYLLPVMDVVAYCLMPTHYHILVRTKDEALVVAETHQGLDRTDAMYATAMMRFGVAYTKAINKRYGRVGRLFQGQYQARLVDRDAYLLHLSRYIHLNPVASDLVTRPEEWEFSSYAEYVGARSGSLPMPGIVVAQIGGANEYRQFVDSLGLKQDEKILHLVIE